MTTLCTRLCVCVCIHIGIQEYLPRRRRGTYTQHLTCVCAYYINMYNNNNIMHTYDARITYIILVYKHRKCPVNNSVCAAGKVDIIIYWPVSAAPNFWYRILYTARVPMSYTYMYIIHVPRARPTSHYLFTRRRYIRITISHCTGDRYAYITSV